MPERTYTTHDIAKICDVYPSSIINWIGEGRIKAHTTPGGHYRVTREDLLAFLTEFRMPIPREVAVRPSRVLIIDDEPEVVRVIERAFERLGADIDVETSLSGIDALIRIGQTPPDLVVLDIVMPRMDGLQVCKILKSKPETRGVKIVAITGKKTPFPEKRPSVAGIDALFRKPLDLGALIARCTELLGAAPRADARDRAVRP